MSARLFHGFGGGDDLFLTLNAARAADYGNLIAADGHVANLYVRIAAALAASGELVRLVDGNDHFHTRQHLHALQHAGRTFAD